ncbi:MAG: TonB-dependent receptor, partial [Psychrosphaera sp.]|nr:TonB-dependent receptor [Psychrosphaera sp.]
LLPSSLVSKLEVYKTPQAHIDEGSIGGTIILRTRKPLDLEANTMTFNVQSQYSETSGKNDPQVDAMYSWRNEDQTFGALVSMTKQDRTVQREGIEILGWTEDENGNYRPKDIGAPIFRQDRDRKTFFGSFQYAPSEDFDITLNVMDSKMEANNHNINLLIRPQNTDVSEFTNVVMDGNNIVAATLEGPGSYEWDFINRESRTQTNSYDLDINYSTDSFTLHAQIGTTSAKGGTFNETSWSFVPTDAANAGYDFDLTQGTPIVNIGVDATNGENWKQNWTWGGNKPTTDKETFAQLDIDVPMNNGFFDNVKAGIKYRDHDRDQGRQAYSWHGPGTSADPDSNYMADAFAQCPTLADCSQSSGVHTVADNVVGGNIGTQLDGSRTDFMRLGFGGDADYAVSNVLGEMWAINESISAAYLSGDFSGDKYRGNVGVRVVQTKQTASSNNYSSDSWGFHTIDRDWLTPEHLEWVTETRTYTDVLPSFNLAYNLSSEKIIRVGVAKVMARANFSDLAPVTTTGALNVAQPVGTAGNPQLEPQKANQFDIAYEWYFNDSSVFSATYFYKDIESYTTSSVVVEQFFNEQSGEYVDVDITTTTNGKGGTSNGLEVGYQQS